ncbi:unnamed protein product [Psylliodes chrysocephalus]|uniref:BESS domain-containing protein n=1 Tax=Psylliodes chrysocephalus TaxID=3402493 RepID=A0A9P0CAI1_9CUCU|nr:unnamed protein product [Psylliodes chrysocephala]
MLQRSGAGSSFTTPWPLMSFFEFMFDHKTPRETSSSVILERNNIYSPSSIMEAEVVSEPSLDESSMTNLEFDSQINQFNLINDHQEASATPPVVNLNRNLEISREMPFTPISVPKRSNKRKKTDNQTENDLDVLGLLGKISNSVEQVTSASPNTRDKLDDFSSYMISELREFPEESREEFIDETIIRLLQIKRKLRQNARP